MNITVSQEALNWFKEEIGLKKGDYLKFFPKIYGSSPVQESYALGFAKEDPIDIIASTEIEGMIFFVESTDLWFFNGHDLQVEYNEKIDELEFTYTISNN
ncbi:HesB/YadR/YfhF family protein [Niallia sp. XMNu-256]|uniref:HesB/YadR/YfhF family protein n=1 Tax=Niallia sp. XMNu-256 TaxID=3082444 RepID=UPI0030CAE1A7